MGAQKEASTSGSDNKLDPPCVVCLGGSAGGLEALQDFFRELPDNPGVPFVVVVHLSPDFKSLMPELLSKCTSMTVEGATDDTAILPDHVYVMSPGKNMILSGGKLKLRDQDRTPGHAPNFPIDLFLTSLAEESGERGIAIILSGTGSDGSRGIRNIKEAGGVIFSQSPDTAKFDGMPVSAIRTGLVDQQGPPASLARRVADLIGRPVLPLPEIDSKDGDEEGDGVHQILELLKKQNGLDMSYLRRQMLSRRIHRRMAIEGIGEILAYVQRLTEDARELERLGEDLLIGVTSFFRDSKAFDALKEEVLQKMLLNVPPQDAVRVWVAACSSGEEAYSIAMLIIEAMAASGIKRDLKIFATDVDQRAVERAARGVFSMSEAADIPPNMLGRYFEQNGTEYVARPELRSRLIFAQHDLVVDPPFTRMHLVACRNLLIYLNLAAQRRVLTTLFAALKPEHGILFLGSAEIPGPIERGLRCINAQAKIFERSGFLPYSFPIRTGLPDPVSSARTAATPANRGLAARAAAQINLLRAVLETTFEQQGSSAAVIDDQSRLVEVITDPLSVFRLPKGKPTDDLRLILDSSLMTAISVGQLQLRGETRSATCVAPDKQRPGHEISVRLCRIFGAPEAKDVTQGLCLLVVEALREPAPPNVISRVDLESIDRVAALELELRQTKESLQGSIEELQSSNEEQQSTNEELLASNEELQSTNEELHSVNEELYTVNAEFHVKNEELLILTADLNNLLNTMSVATLYLDEELRIRRFNPSISRVLPLHSNDAGRALADFNNYLDTDLVMDAKGVLRNRQAMEREVRDRSGAWVLMRMSPYQSAQDQDGGVLATFVDVTRIKNAEETARVVSEQLSKANVKLASKSEQLEDLFSIVAHDLRRPVLGLDSVLKLAQRNLQSNNEAGTHKHLNSAIEILDGLRTMLKDLRDVSQLTHFEATSEPVDLRPWLDGLMQPFVGRAEVRGARLNWSCDNGVFQFARGAAAGLLNNLVENALIHGTSNPAPRVDVSCQIQDGMVRLTVVDNGRGIAAEHHERIFELFRRLNPKETEGSGVGLVAVRRFAQRANGTVRVESTVGQGAKFIAELPLPDPAGESRRDEPRILLVEDDALDAKQVRVALNDFKIHWVSTLADATREVENGDFDLVLLDLSLPDGHGVQLVAPIVDSGRNTPVVILSGQAALVEDALRSSLVVTAMSKDEVETPAFVETVRGILGTPFDQAPSPPLN